MEIKTSLFTPLLVLAFLCSCEKHAGGDEADLNPHAEGFNLEASDDKAIAIANNVMKAMGGRKAYDNTRFIQWNFFGRRDLLWDKNTGNVRIDSPSDSIVYLINVQQDTGSVYIKNQRISEGDSLKKMVERGKSIWINDSYWLLMPFKLKDSGVTLKYLREDTVQEGAAADVLQLTFENVGDTPQNKYEVYVDKADSLVRQWAYFADASQPQPSAVWPWDNYQEVGGLMLSFNRSDKKGPRDVKIFSNLPDSVFTSPSAPDWDRYNLGAS